MKIKFFALKLPLIFILKDRRALQCFPCMQREERFCGVTRKMIRAKIYDANGIQMNKTVALYTKLKM